MRDRIFYSICFGFIFGVLLRSFVLVDIFLVILFSILALFFIFFFYFISKSKWGIIWSCFVLSFCFGVYHYHLVDVSPPTITEEYIGEKVSFVGLIIDEPELKERNKKIIIETLIEDRNVGILVSADLEDDFRYGDEVSVIGRLDKAENFITDTGKEFDYINYLRKDGVLYLMSYPDIEIISRNNGNKIQSILFKIKNVFLEKINTVIRSPENLLMAGLILGEKSNFSDELRQSFVDTGTIHIVALSGYNITIVAEWFMKLFYFLPLHIATSMGILSILLFILMTGASSTAIRAGVMATLALFARATGRNYDVARALVLAGVVMILFNPFVLAHDVSFQLSFIATVAVIFLAPRIEKYFLWCPEKFGLRDIVNVTSAAYIFVLPFILYKMGNLSMVALPANILVLPFIPITMMLGFTTGLFGMISYFVSVPFGYVAYFLLHYELGVISFLASVPYAFFAFPNFPLFLTTLIYIYFIYRLFGRVVKQFFTEPF